MAYTDFHTNQDELGFVGVPELRDPDGNIIYETDYGALLETIVARNDVATLNRYIEINPRGPLCPAEVYYWDPFYVAAAKGSTEALRILIDHCEANPVLFDVEGRNPTPTLGPNERGTSLLNTACYGANPETACFLMDRQPPLGSVHDTNEYGDTPLLDAAASLAEQSFSQWIEGLCTYQWYRDRLTRGEKLINILLDRGACARDSRTTGFFRGHYNEQIAQLRETVLSLVISSGSYGLIKRLIDQGADVQRRDWEFALEWDGIKAIFDHGGSNLVSSFDSMERLPIHWAAMGESSGIDDIIPESELETQIIETFKLLLTINPDAINARDKEGATPLYYAVVAHAGCGTGHSYPVIKYLCDNKADTNFVNAQGQTLLHVLADRCISGKLVDTALINLMLLHGIDINHADSNGNTALHILCRILIQTEAARFLINRGANVTATTSEGDTPFHSVMRGIFILPHTAGRDAHISVTLEDRLKALDDMVVVLQEAQDYSSSLMQQANADGKTPQQLLEETRAKWRVAEERRKRGVPRRNEST